jgi:hypothetical protein
MGYYKQLAVFIWNYQHCPDVGTFADGTIKPFTHEAFRREQLGLPWQASETGGECPSCGKGTWVNGNKWGCYYCPERGIVEGVSVVDLTDKQKKAEKALRKELDLERSAKALRVWQDSDPITTKATRRNKYFM